MTVRNDLEENVMAVKKEDRRVRYTKMVLKESFIDLLEKQAITRISVKDICEGADINRATFYAHYSDPYDLMKQIENELFENLEKHLAVYTGDQTSILPVDTVEHIFDYIRENAKICKLLLGERGDLNFQKRIFQLVYDRFMLEMARRYDMSPEDAEYLYAFILTGCVGVIQKWLNDNIRKSPRYMAETIINLTMSVSGPIMRPTEQKINSVSHH